MKLKLDTLWCVEAWERIRQTAAGTSARMHQCDKMRQCYLLTVIDLPDLPVLAPPRSLYSPYHGHMDNVYTPMAD